MLFWDRLYNMCAIKDCKPNTMAKAIGLSTATVTKWKNGAIPNGDALVKIANYFDCSVDYLLGRTDNPKGNYVSNVNSDNNTIEQNYSVQPKENPVSIPSKECAELVRIYNALPFRQRVRLLSFAVELEQEQES